MSDFNQTLEVFVRQRVQELLPGAVNTALGNVFINVGKQLKEQAVGNAAPGVAMSSPANPDRYKSQSEKMKENWIKRKAAKAAAAAAAASGQPAPVSTETPEEAESPEPVVSEEPTE